MNCLTDSAFNPQTKIRRLLLQCPIAYQSTFNAPQHWFEQIQGKNYLILRVAGDKYTPIREGKDSEKMQYIDTLAGQVAPIVTARVGFEATIIDSQFDLLYLVEQLAYDCTSPDRRRHIPLLLLDFIRPERQDRLRTPDGQEIYTVRSGRIFDLKGAKGAVGRGRSLSGGGFTFKFQELKKRRILG